MLAQVVVHDQNIVALIHEELGHGAAGVGGQVAQSRWVVWVGNHHDGVLQGIVSAQRLDHGQKRRLLLADGDVDADHILVPLANDGVHDQSGLARLPVADNKLALPAPDGHQGVYNLDARLQWLVDWTALNDARCLLLQEIRFHGRNRAALIQRATQRVYHAAQQGSPYRDAQPPARAGDQVATPDALVGPQQDHVQVHPFEVQDHALDASGEGDQFISARLGQPRKCRHAIPHAQYRAHTLEAYLRLQLLRFVPQRSEQQGRVEAEALRGAIACACATGVGGTFVSLSRTKVCLTHAATAPPARGARHRAIAPTHHRCCCQSSCHPCAPGVRRPVRGPVRFAG